MSTARLSLTRESSMTLRYAAFLAERFPPFANGLLIVSYVSCNHFLAVALTEPAAAMTHTVRSVMAGITLLCFFLHLRIFDEHKDYEADCVNYPERVLQRGLVTLNELKVIAAIAIGLELILSAMSSPAALVAVLMTLAFSVLMLKEFFVGEWLEKRLVLYATSHMLIMPLLAMVVFSFSTGRYFWEAPAWYVFYAFVGFFVAFNWEISRKIRSPEQERVGVDSYTKRLGKYGAAYAVLGVRVVDTLMVCAVGWHLGLALWFHLALVGLFAVCLIGVLEYRFKTSPQSASRMEVYAGLYVIAFDLILAAALVHLRGWA